MYAIFLLKKKQNYLIYKNVPEDSLKPAYCLFEAKITWLSEFHKKLVIG